MDNRSTPPDNTLPFYLSSAALESEAEIVEIVAEPRPGLVLSATHFHVQGGGQKGDVGMIAGRAVTGTVKSEDGILHLMEDVSGFQPGDTVAYQVDAAIRALHGRLHTAGHLIAAVVETDCPGGIIATQGHHWPGEGRVSFDRPAEDIEALRGLLAERLEHHIKADHPVRVIGDPYTDRKVQIGDFEPVGCGGTHVASTACLGTIKIKKLNNKGGKLRISYDL